MRRSSLLFILVFLFSLGFGQEKSDSLSIDGWLDGLENPLGKQDLLEKKLEIQTGPKDLADLVPMSDLTLPSNQIQAMPNWHWEGLNLPNFTPEQSPLFKGDYNVAGVIWGNRRQLFYGSGYQQHIPGIGVSAQAKFGYAFLINNRLSVSVNGGVSKQVGLMPIVSTFGNMGATVNYSINDHLSLHGFADFNANVYDTRQWNVNYGAYLDWQMNDHWGADVGVQHTQDHMGYGRTQPIIRPYYKMSNGAKLGIDFGGLIQDAINKKNGIGAGLGIMPSPKQFITMPRVAPRN